MHVSLHACEPGQSECVWQLEPILLIWTDGRFATCAQHVSQDGVVHRRVLSSIAGKILRMLKPSQAALGPGWVFRRRKT